MNSHALRRRWFEALRSVIAHLLALARAGSLATASTSGPKTPWLGIDPQDPGGPATSFAYEPSICLLDCQPEQETFSYEPGAILSPDALAKVVHYPYRPR